VDKRSASTDVLARAQVDALRCAYPFYCLLSNFRAEL